MLPAIQTHARCAFRHLDPEAREEAVEEAIANAFVAFVRLVELGKTEVAYPTVLAGYAVAQIQDGRRVGNRRNGRDVLSPYAQKRNRIDVERLDRFDKEDRRMGRGRGGRPPDAHPGSGRVPLRLPGLAGYPVTAQSADCRVTRRRPHHGRSRPPLPGLAREGLPVARELHRSWQEYQSETPAAAETAEAV